MLKYSDVYVQTVARGLMNPGEQLVAAGAGNYQSFWTFSIPFFKHSYLILATSERLIVIDHRKGLIFDRMDKVDSYRWSDIGTMKLGGFLFGKKLVIKDANNRVMHKLKVPGFMVNPLANNVAQLRTVVQTWEQRKAMPAGPQYGQLPQSAQQGYAPPQPQYTPPQAYS